jgi:SNF2 family DNA or RNA helicase
MSRRRPDADQHHRILGEDETSSDGSETGLDILTSTRRKLDLSQYIDAVTSQSQSQPSKQQSKDRGQAEEATDAEFSDDNELFAKPRPGQRKRSPPRVESRRVAVPAAEEAEGGDPTTSVTEEGPSSPFQDPFSDEDPSAEYRNFKARTTLKRKAAAAETNRIRAQKKARTAAAAAKSIIGRKPVGRKGAAGVGTRDTASYGAGSDTENADKEKEKGTETYLDEPTLEYIEARKKKLKGLHDAGLRYPPCYDDIDFSDNEEEKEEKPVLHPNIKTQREKKDIKLQGTAGVIPAPIAQWLRDYQVDGVQFLHERFVRQTGAILGDDMGLGKTIQVIAFLTAAFGKTGTKRDAKLMRKVRRAGDDRWYPRVLIVCPGGLMQNWEDELEKWGWWQVDKYHGNPKDKRGILNAMKGGRSEIMITTYSTYRNSESEINTIDWDCVIADECHQIKSRNAEITKAMNKVNALCRIGLTGTAIQNKYEELWNLLNWARPGDYGSAQEWKQHISIPLKMGQAHDASYNQLANARTKAKELVETILPDVFLRRMKTLIAHQLPKKSDRVVFCQLTETQADAYRSFIESDICEYIRRAKEPCDCQSGRTRGWCCYQSIPGYGKWGHWMFPAMIVLMKLANHLALLLPQASDTHDKQAKDYEDLKLACPDTYQDLYRIKDNILNQSQREFCGKWSVLKRLLNFWHKNGDKVLVFSHSVRLLRLLKALFDIDGTKYNWSYLDGSMSLEDRSKAVADFNSNPAQFVFLISTKAGGVGLNITSANKVVVMDPNWNPAYDLQAQDRAYRIGQTRDVEVFRLVSSGTIEEIVYARQIYKQQQANIGYTASDERRYFKGVMDSSEKKGELFGLENLFSFEESGYLLRDIVRKTNVAETRAGVSAMDFKLADDDDDASDDDILSNKNLGIIDDDDAGGADGTKQLKKFADSFASTGSAGKLGLTNVRRKGHPDPIHAILAKAGVQYTHENSEVIGKSRIEAELSRRALEVRNDSEMGSKRVFQFSQSQSQSQHQGLAYSEEDESDDEVRVLGEARRENGGREEFKINYKYRPNESVRTRQFCEMSRWMGFQDPVEFALVVEHMSAEERVKTLNKFYRARRRAIAAELNGEKR